MSAQVPRGNDSLLGEALANEQMREAYARGGRAILRMLFKPYGYEYDGDASYGVIHPMFWHPEDEDGSLGYFNPAEVLERLTDQADAKVAEGRKIIQNLCHFAERVEHVDPSFEANRSAKQALIDAKRWLRETE